MIRSLWTKFFLLLVAVSAIALSSAFLVREFMISDFRGYLEGDIEDRAYWVTAALESSYERDAGWRNESLIEDTVWALMLGFELRLYDSAGAILMNTEKAVGTLSPLVKKRVGAISEQRSAGEAGRYHPYALFLGGREIGRLELRFLHPKKGGVFIRRSNRLLLFSILGLGGIAIILSIVVSRRLTNPIKVLTDAVSAVGAGDLKKRVAKTGDDELGRLSEAFNRMAQALEIQESLRRRLTANVAHELRTPLSAIRGELEGMIDGLIPADREHMQSLYEEIGRFRRIIEGIEELSRAEASSLTINKINVELKAFLTNIAERYRKIFAEKGVGLDLECEKEITVRADPDSLSRIMINLLSNALKATEAGGRVSVAARRKDKTVVIEIADNGRGIKKEDLPFIFERFYRAAEGGLGLGLTIVKELVAGHGGSVDVQSEYGKGTVFTVTLPV